MSGEALIDLILCLELWGHTIIEPSYYLPIRCVNSDYSYFCLCLS